MRDLFETGPDIQALVERGALFAVNHSGGKDSDATLITLRKIVPARQLLVVHATLADVEWPGTMEHAKTQADAAGLPFIVAAARKIDGTPRTFVNMVEDKFARVPGVPSFPLAKQRQCTSDLKRGPLDREIFAYMRRNGFHLLVNCEGIRAQESAHRAKRTPFAFNAGASKAGRECYDWLPIFDLTTAQVFETIAQAGQKPHWAYGAGNERLSCVFCIMGSPGDIKNGAKHNPELFEKMAALEERTGYALHMSRRTLREIVGS